MTTPRDVTTTTPRDVTNTITAVRQRDDTMTTQRDVTITTARDVTNTMTIQVQRDVTNTMTTARDVTMTTPHDVTCTMIQSYLYYTRTSIIFTSRKPVLRTYERSAFLITPYDVRQKCNPEEL